MKKLPSLILLSLGITVCLAVAQNDATQQKEPTFEDAIAIIKKYESLSGASHWPFVGYGHLVMPGEKFTKGKALTAAEADALVRADYAKLCARYRQYGADSLLLAALAYNCGPGVVAKSSVLSKLKAGDRDIEAAYIAHSKYKGKQLSQLKRRRQEELATLFVKYPATSDTTMVTGIETGMENMNALNINITNDLGSGTEKTDSAIHESNK
ncbi:MAG: glycoside hydrolase family protein [Muribaculaceae bacterium]|nr:glycoside hydrolase family protein [Muribaculaceae bacterium]